MKRITETMEVSGVSFIVDRIRSSSSETQIKPVVSRKHLWEGFLISWIVFAEAARVVVSRKQLWEGFLISWMVYSQKQRDRITETWNEVELSNKESEFISQRSSEEHYFSYKA